MPRVEVGPHRRALDPDPWRGSVATFLQAVRTAELGGVVDPALRPAASAQNTDEDPHGGFFVPQTLASIVPAVGRTSDPALGRMTELPMTAPVVGVASRVDKNHSASVAGGLVVYRPLQGDTVPDSRMKLEQIRLRAVPLCGLTYASMEIVQDSFPTFLSWLEAGFADAFAEQQLEERLRGSGVGEYAGVLHSPALVTIAKESGQSAGTVVADNIMKMRARSWGYDRAVWLIHPELFEQVVTAAAPIGTGGSIVPVWQPGDDDTPDRILGRPAFFTHAASLPGQVGDVMCVTWSEVLHGAWRPFEGTSSIYARFVAFENAYRFTLRDDCKPWWTSALTPKRATVSVSPFVTLAARG